MLKFLIPRNVRDWGRKVRRERERMFAGPFSLAWWLVRAALRVAFMLTIFLLLGLVATHPDVLGNVADGAQSPTALLVVIVGDARLLALAGLVAVLSFLAPFLPDRNDQYG